MSLNVNDFQLLQKDYQLSKRMRFTLAHMFGFRVPSFLPEILRHASSDEMQVWLNLQKAVHETHFQNFRLIDLAEQGLREYTLEQTFAEGRDYARDLGVDALLEGGIGMRHDLNPYGLNQLRQKQREEALDEELRDAWDDGFKSYFESVCPEAW
jgi:hypothetical protein